MSDNVRVYEIAEEAGASSNEVIAKAKDLGIELKSPQTAVSFEDAEEIANYIMTGKSSKLKKPAAKIKKAAPKTEEKPEVKTEEKKAIEDTPKKEEVKVEDNKEEEKTEEIVEKPEEKPLKSVSPKKIIPKRRGLKIIKKKKPQEKIETSNDEIATPASNIKKPMKSLSEILGGNDLNDNPS
jgi:translation initiation factor IF-2